MFLRAGSMSEEQQAHLLVEPIADERTDAPLPTPPSRQPAGRNDAHGISKEGFIGAIY